MKHQHREETDCLNCGAEIKGKFCSNCGQENLDLHESFWNFMGHSVGHYFHFDSKFFNTLKPLITKPGQLSLDYLNGKRARYIQPVSLFIFISVIFFLVTPLFKQNNKIKAASIKILTPDTYPIRLKLDSSSKSDFDKKVFKKQFNKFLTFSPQQKKITVDSLKNILHRDSTNKDLNIYISKFTTENKIINFGLGDNSSEFINHYGSKIYFLLTPIFGFFLMLNFRKNRKIYIEHVIYTLHFQSFVFIVMFFDKFLSIIKIDIFNTIISLIASVVILWYSFVSLKLFYKRSTPKTIWKMFGLFLLYGIAYVIAYKAIFFLTERLH